LTQGQATDLGVSALDRGQLDDSRALIKVKILFGHHKDISAQKMAKISIFCRIFPKKQYVFFVLWSLNFVYLNMYKRLGIEEEKQRE
jgi:hypothetical protein